MEFLKIVGFFIIAGLAWRWAASNLQGRGWPIFSRHLAGVLAGFLVAVLIVGLTVKVGETKIKECNAKPNISVMPEANADSNALNP